MNNGEESAIDENLRDLDPAGPRYANKSDEAIVEQPDDTWLDELDALESSSPAPGDIDHQVRSSGHPLASHAFPDPLLNSEGCSNKDKASPTDFQTTYSRLPDLAEKKAISTGLETKTIGRQKPRSGDESGEKAESGSATESMMCEEGSAHSAQARLEDSNTVDGVIGDSVLLESSSSLHESNIAEDAFKELTEIESTFEKSTEASASAGSTGGDDTAQDCRQAKTAVKNDITRLSPHSSQSTKKSLRNRQLFARRAGLVALILFLCIAAGTAVGNVIFAVKLDSENVRSKRLSLEQSDDAAPRKEFMPVSKEEALKLSALLESEGKPQEALARLLAVEDQESAACDFDYLHLRGRLSMKTGDLESAEDDLRNAVRLEPRDRSSGIDLAAVLYLRKEYASALKEYERLARYSSSRNRELGKNDISENANSARGYGLEKNNSPRSKKDEILAPSENHDFDPDIIYGRALCLFALNKTKLAEKELLRLSVEQPGNEKVYEQISIMRMGRRDYDGAIEIARDGLMHCPDSAILNYQIGLALHKSGDLREANLYYAKAIEKEPNRKEYLNDRGYLNLELEDYEAAIKDFQKALEIDPEYDLARENLKVAKKHLST